MPLFEYRGMNAAGKSAKGSIEAESSRSARQKLKSKGIYTTHIAVRAAQDKKGTKAAISFGTGVRIKDLTIMNRQLATLVKARIPLDEALSALIDQTENTKLKSVLSKVKESVNEGNSLAKSCEAFPKVFTPMYTSMIQVGEVSGNLDLVLQRLADFSESQLDLRNKVIGAMFYPAVMIGMGGLIIIFLFAFAVPKIAEVFASSKMALPWLTATMIQISDVISAHWITIILSLVGLFFLFKWYTSTQKGREQWDYLSLKIPVFGKLKRMIAVSRFARTMSTLIGSGVQLLEAIEIVKDVVDNAVIRKALIQSRESISEGRTIAAPLRASGQFPPILTHMVAVGEKTGELEEMLNVVADAYDSQVDAAINAMMRLLEPLMIIVMGGIIAVVALSIFMPMLQMNNLSALG